MSVVITGLGLTTSIGRSCEEVMESLRSGRNGIATHPEYLAADAPVSLAGLVPGFSFPAPDFTTWTWPDTLQIPRDQLRSLPPHGVYALHAVSEAFAQAGLKLPSKNDHSDPGMGLLTASAGSTSLLYEGMTRMFENGVDRCSPFIVTSSICGTLTFNLAAILGITGQSGGCVSGCASSAQAIGIAADQIRLGRQHTMIVVGAEDTDLKTGLPFASARALTTKTDPNLFPCPFDQKRDGFAPTGGAAVLILEDADHASQRGATVLAELAGWGWSSDGHHPMVPEPEGYGLERAIKAALHDAKMQSEEIDYINAHAPGTPAGDAAELSALGRIFKNKTLRPWVSSTKSQTGHALSMAGALEAAITVLALKNGLVPGNWKLTDPDPATQTPYLRFPKKTESATLRSALSNSSAFGGTNVALILRAAGGAK